MVEGFIGKLGVTGMNEKGRKLNELCMGKKLSWGKRIIKIIGKLCIRY